jgi:hypothetical protein
MNKLSGTILDGSGSIHNLQELYLPHNNLSGHIPSYNSTEFHNIVKTGSVLQQSTRGSAKRRHFSEI